MFDALFCLVSWDGFDVFPSFAHALLIRGLLPLVAASIHGEFQALLVAQTRKLSWNGATIKLEGRASEKHRSRRQVRKRSSMTDDRTMGHYVIEVLPCGKC
jgi:hypothetical protein